MSDIAEVSAGPVRLATRRKMSLKQVLIIGLAVGSGAMLALAMPPLIESDGIAGAAKALLVGASGTIMAYGANRLAVDWAAPLAAVGHKSAGVFAVTSILFVGSALFTATFSGLTLPSVERLRLEAHGAALHQHVAVSSQAASSAAQIVPAINAVATDLSAKRDCEARSSCVSGAGNGGRGRIFRALDDVAGRAEVIAAQVANGTNTRRAIAARLNDLLARYQATSGATDISPAEKRHRLQQHHAQILQSLGELNEAAPRALLAGFAAELGAGAEISGRPEASRQFAAILRGHGGTLSGVVASIPGGGPPPPSFPAETGVTDTLSYMGHFAPIAAITAAIELVVPLVLWIYSFLIALWARDRIAEREPARLHEEDEEVLRLFALPGDRSTQMKPPAGGAANGVIRAGRAAGRHADR